MNKKQLTIIFASILIGAGTVTVAIFRAGDRNNSSTNSATTEASETSRVFTKDELAGGNGMNGNPCYVALDGSVYQIGESLYWKDGQHTKSEGKAYCGADMSAVISQSPHGKTILGQLKKIGTLAE